MARLTISLSDERHRALKEAAVNRGMTIGEIIEESLEFYGIKTAQSAAEYVAQARRKAGLPDSDALAIAVDETRAERQKP